MKNKKILFTIIMILIALIVIAVGAIATLYFTTDMLKSNDQLFAKYLFQENGIESILVSEVTQAQKQFKEDHSYTSEGKLLVDLEMQGQSVNLAQVDLNSQYDHATKRSLTEGTLKKEEEELLKFSYGNTNDIYAIKCEEIYQNYIGIRNNGLKEFARKMGASEEEIAKIPDSISFDKLETKELISKQDAKYLTDTYLPILNDTISKENYTKKAETIVVDGKTYEANGYVLTLNEEEIRKICISILTKAKDDSETIRILETMITSTNLEGIEEEPINVSEALGELLEEIQSAQMEPINLEITAYQVDGKNRRTQIKVNDTTIVFDIVSNTSHYQKVIFTIDGMELNEETGKIETIVEKTISNEQTIHDIQMIVEDSSSTYEISANITLGNVTENGIQNESSFIIKDKENNSVTISYENHIKTADGNLEILELKGSNTVIVNNYPREQLEPFATSIMQKAVEVFGTVIQKLGII